VGSGLIFVMSIDGERFMSGTGKSGSQLRELLSIYDGQECSDPRDHIFGILGLTKWAKRRLGWPHLIQPSHVKSVSDCMRDATRVVIQEDRDLSVLLHWDQVGQCPTWAVHWHMHKHIWRNHCWSHIASVSGRSSQDLGLFDLDLMDKGLDLNTLLVKGILISSIRSTAPLLKPIGGETPGFWVTALEEVLRCVMDLSTRTGLAFSPHTIALTLLASVYKDQVCTSETEEFCRFESVVSSVWDELHGQSPEQCLDLLASDIRLWIQFSMICSRSTLFVTEAGQLCVGPERVREGDKIVRLFGLPLSAVLRPKQWWYTFAGVAYIDREFPDIRDTSTLQPEIYEIR
jgi:hypothetical protein